MQIEEQKYMKENDFATRVEEEHWMNIYYEPRTVVVN